MLALRALGMTAVELARRSGVDTDTISRITRDNRAQILRATAEAILAVEPPAPLADLDRSWVDHATCRAEQHPTSLFFPEKGGDGRVDAQTAKTVCARCPVSQECLEYALAAREQWGVWGGATPMERRSIARRRRRRQRGAR